LNVNDFYDHLNDGTCLKKNKRENIEEEMLDIDSVSQIKYEDRNLSNNNVSII